MGFKLYFDGRLEDPIKIEGLNPAIKAFLASELMFWSGWNLVMPIFAVFVTTKIPGATVSIAAYALTAHLLTRMVFELLSGRWVNKMSNPQRAVIDILGMIIVSVAYLVIALNPTITTVYLYYILAGVGFGIASPAKLSFFSRNMEKDTEATIWSVHNVVLLSGMAVATAVGGIVAEQYGFRYAFLLSSAINILGVVPYLFFIRYWRKQRLLARAGQS